jgi:LytS/YehU family sensor histidine kinase
MDEWRPGTRAANMLPDSLLICGFVTAGYYFRQRGLERIARLRAAQLERARLTRQTLESRLQAMQACIEPEFLFDTLAEVERRCGADVTGAARMLDDLIVYLRAALPHLHDTTSTVGKESGLALAYLNIQKRRFADRVRFDIAVATDAQDAAMPPMILLPLIDHVFLRGLDAETGGGRLRIDFHIVDGKLRVSLGFTGAGFPNGSEHQAEVAGIRNRLTALYGATAARMELHAGDRDGIELVMEIPHEPGLARSAQVLA